MNISSSNSSRINHDCSTVCSPSKQNAATGSEEPVAASIHVTRPSIIKESEMKRNENLTIVKCKQCGEETVVEFYPNESEKKKRSRAKNALCRECYKKNKASKAAEYNKRKGYSTLKGTPKQIDWAESIRKQHIFRIVNHLEIHGQNNFAKRAEKHLGSKTSAKWWIEHSDYSTVEAYIHDKINRATIKAS